MILYLKIRYILNENGELIIRLINIFPNDVTSALDGDLPIEVAPARACTVSDSCSNNAVRCRFVSSWLLLL